MPLRQFIPAATVAGCRGPAGAAALQPAALLELAAVADTSGAGRPDSDPRYWPVSINSSRSPAGPVIAPTRRS